MRSYFGCWPALAAALAVASCSSGDGVPAAASSPVAPADEAIAAMLYAGSPRTPAGFQTDAAPPGYSQVTTYHLKSSQLASPPGTAYELCTDDWSTALAWSEEVAARASPYLDLVANEATARYFEFGRVPRGSTERYVRQRVFRCAYLDRAGVDLDAATGHAGVLHARPLDAASLRDFAEYAWQFTTYNNAGHAVLASEAALPGPEHVLTLASLERGASCDRVTVREWAHVLNAATGALRLDTRVVRELGVRQEGGAIVPC